MKSNLTETVITSPDRSDVAFDEESLLDTPKGKRSKTKVVDEELTAIDNFLNSVIPPEVEYDYLPCQISIHCPAAGDITLIGKLQSFSSSYSLFEIVALISFDEFKKVYTKLLSVNSSHAVLQDIEVLTENNAYNDDENDDSQKENFTAMPLSPNTKNISDILFSITTNTKSASPTAKVTIRCGC